MRLPLRCAWYLSPAWRYRLNVCCRVSCFADGLCPLYVVLIEVERRRSSLSAPHTFEEECPCVCGVLWSDRSACGSGHGAPDDRADQRRAVRGPGLRPDAPHRRHLPEWRLPPCPARHRSLAHREKAKDRDRETEIETEMWSGMEKRVLSASSARACSLVSGQSFAVVADVLVSSV